MQQRDVVAEHGGFAHHHAGAVVNHNAVAEAGGGVDVDTKHFGGAVLQEIGQCAAALLPQPVVDAVRLDGVKAFVIQQRQRIRIASGIALVVGHNIGQRRFNNAVVTAQCVEVNLVQRARVHNRAGQFAGQMKRQHALKALVAQHGEVQKAGQRGLVGTGLLGFAADGVPEGVALRLG